MDSMALWDMSPCAVLRYRMRRRSTNADPAPPADFGQGPEESIRVGGPRALGTTAPRRDEREPDAPEGSRRTDRRWRAVRGFSRPVEQQPQSRDVDARALFVGRSSLGARWAVVARVEQRVHSRPQAS